MWNIYRLLATCRTQGADEVQDLRYLSLILDEDII